MANVHPLTEDGKIGTAPTTISEQAQREKYVRFLPESFTTRISTPGIHMLSDKNVGVVRRGLWSIMFLGAISFTGWNISKQIIKYYSDETETSTTVIKPDISVFPTLTFCCYENGVNSSALYALIMSILQFGNKPVNRHEIAIVDTMHGQCLQFNPRGKLETSDSSYFSNFLICYTEMANLVKNLVFDVYIQPHYKPASTYILSDQPLPLLVETDFSKEIRIRKIIREHKNPEIGKCISKTGQNSNYSRNICLAKCFIAYVSENHGCDIFDEERRSFRKCEFWKNLEKIDLESDVFLKLKKSRCKEKCLDDCLITSYSQLVYANYPTHRNPKKCLSIHYETLDYEHIVTRKSYDGYQLLCDTGGAFGLLLGATLITLLDLIDMLVMFILALIRKKLTYS